jgi:hypothetical protein
MKATEAKRLRRLADQREQATPKLIEACQTARKGGALVREIAAATGLSRQTIHAWTK